MQIFSVEVPDDVAAGLRQLAEKQSTTPEKLAAQIVSFRTRADTDDFKLVARHIVNKNRNLYRQLG
jgi:predicted transcriptional regulator